MPEAIPLWFMPIYGLMWTIIARLAVELWRSSQRGQRARARRQIVMRLSRWRDC